MRFSLLRTTVLALAAAFFATGCSVFHRREAKAPVVGTMRTPDSPTPTTAARDLADVMATELRLTPTQTTQVRQILSSTVTEVNAARQKYPPKSAPLTAEFKRINASSESQLRQTLGPATYQEFQKKKRQIQAQLQQRR